MTRPRAVLDACVLYPTVMRELLIGVAERGGFDPVWSERLLEEWARAAARLGTEAEIYARGEIAQLSARWPKAQVAPKQGLATRLWLPDAGDVHVLGSAITSGADVIVTMNAKDFPRNILAEEGISRADPDNYLLGFFHGDAQMVREAAQQVLARACELSNQPWEMRKLLKKARLPRLAKALSL